MKKWIRSILFKIEFYYWKWVIKQIKGNMFSYPILLSMEFNPDYYKKYYIEGMSFPDIVKKKINVFDISMKRHLNRLIDKPSIEVYKRLGKLQQIRENRLEVEQHFKNNPGLEEEIQELMNN